MDTIEKAVAKLSKNGKSAPLPVGEGLRQDLSLSGGASSAGQQRPVSNGRDILVLGERLKAEGFLCSQGENVQQMEEYRRIKRPLLMNIDSKGEGKSNNLIMVTSSMPGEGKTFTSINLAVSIAMELDRTVLFVDADVHKPAASTLLGTIDYLGLTDVLASDSLNVADVLIKTDVPKITLLSVGRDRNNSNELLASSNMTNLMNELAQRYQDRVVIIDTPPILVTNEAAILANLVGQVVIVVEAEKTQQSVLEDALSIIDIENLNVGLVLNKGRITSGKSGYYYGGYGGYPGGD